MKPRVSYAEFKASLPDFDSMIYGETELLLDGEKYIYEGHNGKIVWLRNKSKVLAYRQSDVVEKLRTRPL